MSGDGLFGRLGEQLDAQEPDPTPPTMSDILDLPDEPRSLMRHVLRAPSPLTPGEAAEGLGWELATAQRVIGDLSFRGMIAVIDGRIKVSSMQRNTRPIPGGMWGILNDL
jgi:hypothetical protein